MEFELNLDENWDKFDVNHAVTTAGIQKFVADYKSPLKLTA
jgi:hypothetical protein